MIEDEILQFIRKNQLTPGIINWDELYDAFVWKYGVKEVDRAYRQLRAEGKIVSKLGEDYTGECPLIRLTGCCAESVKEAKPYIDYTGQTPREMVLRRR